MLTYSVAKDDFGTPGASARVQAGSPWTMPATVQAADHTVIFGDEVVISYGATVPDAAYEIELTFASDSPNRKVRVLADDAVLDPELVLPHNAELKQTYQIPAAVTRDGGIELIIRKISGENAVLSAATVRSGNPQVLTVPPISFPEVTLTPLPVSEEDKLPLNGIWKFHAQAPVGVEELTTSATDSWDSIEVPGQWRNQGHDLPAGQTTAYATTFDRPATWKDQLAKIRFDAVYSKCRVFLNGRTVGGHEGGFTPFECDLTSSIKDKGNLLVLTVTSASLADTMASASQYACQQLGGISRSVTLFAVPPVHLSDFAVRTDFDADYKDATLEIKATVDASGADGAGEVEMNFTLDGIALPAAGPRLAWTKPGLITKTFTLPVTAPKWWTPETPNLYQLGIACGAHHISRKIGFREIEVKGTRVLVNGRPVKLRGVNRHETNPLRGRSLAPGQWRTDVQLFRDANVNLIRTCHYPPDHQLLEAADELGVWVELECPFCWENGAGNPSHRGLAMRQTAESIKRDRNNPSVLFWSLGNESAWGNHFEQSAKMLLELDPSRPKTFEWMNNTLNETDIGSCEIGAVHYPGFNGPKLAKAQSKRPVFMGEYCHLNAYNRRELMTDPGLRDRWGLYLSRLWEQMDAEPNILGGAIWSGIDDTFFPSPELTLGYGAWGPIDGWRRTKPEYWHMKKVYSPVRIDELEPVTLRNGTITIPVENRSDFINLSKLECHWQLGVENGTLRVDVGSKQRGQVVIHSKQDMAPQTGLELSFFDPRGFETNRFHLEVDPLKVPDLSSGGPPLLTTTGELHEITGRFGQWMVNRKTGAIRINNGEGPVVTGGPHLMLIPENNEGETQMTGKTRIHDAFNPICSGWQFKEVRTSKIGTDIQVDISGSYAEAEGSYRLRFTGDHVVFSYDFKVKRAINPRQTGVAFDFAAGFDRLTWTRRGLWSAYPDNHIGRLSGSALAVTPDGKDAIETGPRENPGESPWSHDNTRYGSNDFRSTKENIVSAEIGRTKGHGLRISSDGSQSVRAWLDPDTRRTWLLVANHTNGGAERFLRGLAAPDKRPLKPGDRVQATFQIAVP